MMFTNMFVKQIGKKMFGELFELLAYKSNTFWLIAALTIVGCGVTSKDSQLGVRERARAINGDIRTGNEDFAISFAYKMIGITIPYWLIPGSPEERVYVSSENSVNPSYMLPYVGLFCYIHDRCTIALGEGRYTQRQTFTSYNVPKTEREGIVVYRRQGRKHSVIINGVPRLQIESRFSATNGSLRVQDDDFMQTVSVSNFATDPPLPTNLVKTIVKSVGNNKIETNSSKSTTLRAVRYSMPSSGSIAQISIYHAGISDYYGHWMVAGIYEDNGSVKKPAPTNLLAKSGLNYVAGRFQADWQVLKMLKPTKHLSAGTKFWIAFQFDLDANPGVRFAKRNATVGVSQNRAFDYDLPASFGPIHARSNAAWSLFAEYAEATP